MMGNMVSEMREQEFGHSFEYRMVLPAKLKVYVLQLRWVATFLNQREGIVMRSTAHSNFHDCIKQETRSGDGFVPLIGFG
jgi:hypothetical protein